MTPEEEAAYYDDLERERDEMRIPRMADDIDPGELDRALRGLIFLGDGLAMRMQVTNIAIVDNFIMKVETTVRNRLHEEERTPVDDASFLNAQSQMWIFATYELLRTWRQRLEDILKLQKNGGLQSKIDALRKDRGYRHYDREFYASQLERVQKDSATIDTMQTDLRKTAIPFTRLEFLRVALAKHEVSGKEKSFAFNPGYARIDRFTGSLQYEMSNEKYITDTVTRRDIADDIRAFPMVDSLPTDDDIKEFKRCLQGKIDMPSEPF